MLLFAEMSEWRKSRDVIQKGCAPSHVCQICWFAAGKYIPVHEGDVCWNCEIVHPTPYKRGLYKPFWERGKKIAKKY